MMIESCARSAARANALKYDSASISGAARAARGLCAHVVPGTKRVAGCSVWRRSISGKGLGNGPVRAPMPLCVRGSEHLSGPARRGIGPMIMRSGQPEPGSAAYEVGRAPGTDLPERPRYGQESVRHPAAAERAHEIDRKAEECLAVANQRKLRLVERALSVEHLQIGGIARLVAHRGEPQCTARLLDLRGEVLFGVGRQTHVGKRVAHLAESVLDRLLVADRRLAGPRLGLLRARGVASGIEDGPDDPEAERPDAGAGGEKMSQLD